MIGPDHPQLCCERLRTLDVLDTNARAATAVHKRAGLLEEYTGRAWGRVWIARTVVDVLERPL